MSDTTLRCQICGLAKPPDEIVSAYTVHGEVAEYLRETRPDWDPEGYICWDDLDIARADYIEQVLIEEKGELSELENEVVRSFEEGDLIAEDTNETFDRQLTLGERVADRMAAFGGSWSFIGMFVGILLVWMIINSGLILVRPFDPYPFILLNLVLSSLAAFQAPIIMMSQNRQAEKDRLQTEQDYQVNLKSELEIRQLHEKLDYLMSHQWERLADVQRVQTDLLRDLARRVEQQQTLAIKDK